MRLSLILFSLLITSVVSYSQGNSTQDEATRLSVEAVALFTAGKLSDAQAKAKQVVSLRESRDGNRGVELALAWRNLGYIEMALKDLKATEIAFDNALEILEANQPLSTNDERMFADVLEAAAYFDINNRTLGKSESRLKKAVEIRERLDGAASKKLADPLRTLGQLHYARAEYEKAVPLLLRSLELGYDKAEKVADDDLVVRETLQCSLRKADRTSEAEEIGKRFRSSTVGASGIPVDRTISGGVVNGKALNLAKPVYPREARANNDQGAVSVKVLINEAGKVIFACAVSGPKSLQATSEQSAYQSTFSPTRLKGEPVRVSGVLTYNFKY